jgi:hypothetical protein
MKIGTALLLAVVVLCVVGLAGCGGGDGGGNPPGPTGGTVTGEVYARSGGDFVPLGGQRVSIRGRNITTTSDAVTGRFALTGVPQGPFVVDVTPTPGFGEVLNPEILDGTVAEGQTVDVGRVLLGERPPAP